MMSENTAAHTLATRMIGDEKQSIFFVGLIVLSWL
jgi:hypothetical protein